MLGEYCEGEKRLPKPPIFQLPLCNLMRKALSIQESYSNMHQCMFSHTSFIRTLFDYTIHCMQTGSLRNVSWFNKTFYIFLLNVNFLRDFILIHLNQFRRNCSNQLLWSLIEIIMTLKMFLEQNL